MSHFSVLVFMKGVADDDDWQDALTEALAPYDEAIEVEPYEVRLGPVADRVARARDWLTHDPQPLRSYPGAGKDVYPECRAAAEALDQIWRDRPELDLEVTVNEKGDVVWVNPDDAATAISFIGDDLLVQAYCGEDHLIRGSDIYQMSRYNPQSKWDWWVPGGRWSGYFTSTAGVKDDALRWRDVDLQAMRDEAKGEALRTYDLLEEVTAGTWTAGVRPFAEIRDEELARRGLPVALPEEEGEAERDKRREAVEVARAIYGAQPWMRALRGHRHLDLFSQDPVEWYCVNTGGCEEYVRRQVAQTGIPFAMLVDGQWQEKGSMGWWGMVSDEKDPDAWQAHVLDVFAETDPDTVVIAVDCHI